jgi:hypothetical protein
MPVHYYWTEDFNEDPDRGSPTTIVQTIEVSDDGTLVYEARNCTAYSWADAYRCWGFGRVQSKEDAIQRLQTHREDFARQLAYTDLVLEAAQKAHSFMDITDYDDDQAGE